MVTSMTEAVLKGLMYQKNLERLKHQKETQIPYGKCTDREKEGFLSTCYVEAIISLTGLCIPDQCVNARMGIQPLLHTYLNSKHLTWTWYDYLVWCD